MMVNKLMALDTTIQDEERIKQIHSIPKMKKEYKNKRK